VTEVGGPTWRCRIHAGVYAKVKCFVERVRVQAFTNVGIIVQADREAVYPAGPSIANGGGASQCTVSQCGVGVLALGPDSNNCVFSEVAAVDSGYALYGTDPDAPAEDALQGAVGLWDEAQAGARWIFCLAEATHNGRSVYVRSLAFSHGSMIVGLHEEGAGLAMHVAAGTYMGGITSARFTVFLQGHMKNFYMQDTPTALPGVTTNLQLPGDHDTSSPNDGVLAGGTSDTVGRWNLHYGANLLPHYWGLRFKQESCFFAFTVDGADSGAGELNGPSLLWLPRGAFRGTAGGYPDWYEFVDEGEVTSTYVRGRKREPGDRYRTTTPVTSLGSPAERVVLSEGYDALPNYPGGAGGDVVAIPGDGVNSWSWRSTQPGQKHKVFRAKVGGAPGGGGEPDVSGAVVPGDVVNDGPVVQWEYVGDAPTFGSLVLGVTVSGTDPDGLSVNLTDDVERELSFADGRAYSLRISVLGRDRGAPAVVGRHVYELLVSANGALTIVDPAPPPGPLVGAGTLPAGWAIALGTVGLALRISCTGAVGAVVDFTARVEVTPLAALA